MELADWSRFQAQYTDVWTKVFSGDRRTALFIEAASGAGAAVVLIPAFKAEVFEALSPGGWQDCNDARERKWSLLTGDARAWEDNGLEKPTV
jgi:hypothetical protein